MSYIVPREPVAQPQQVEATAIQLTGAMGFLITVLFGFWVLQQGIKVFKGEEIERPV